MPILKVKDEGGRWVGVFCGSGKATDIESSDYPGCYYRNVNGEKEWINPPMVFNTVYRTSERFNGKVVYACAVEIPELTDASMQAINLHSIVNGSPQVIDLHGTITYNGLDYEHIPLYKGETSYFNPYVDFGDAGLVIEQSGYHGCYGRLVFKFIYND